MNKYLAGYQNGRDECWDLVLCAKTWKDAAKDARSHQKEFGKLWSLRRIYK